MQAFISDQFNPRLTGRIIYCWMVLLMPGLLTTCKKEEIASKDYPRVNTLEVTGINESGAIFNAELISGNRSEIKEYGFVWDTTLFPEVDSHDKLIITGVPGSQKFSGNIHSALKKEITYYMRAYVRTAKLLIYGKVVSFKSMGSEAPQISGFSPETGTWGDTIKVTGKNFRYRISGIVVKLGDVPAKIISGTDTTINLIVPAKKNSEKVNLSVSVEGNNSAGLSHFTYLIPVISGINPLSATYNDTVYISGVNFFNNASDNKVCFNGSPVTIVYASGSLLKVLVPASLLLSQAKISIAGPVNDIEFGSQFSLKDIVLHCFEPDTVFLSDEIITIKGENFNPVSINNKVTIKGLNASVIETSPGQLKVRLPAAILPEKFFSLITDADITVTTGQQAIKFNKNLEICLKSRWTKKKDFPGDPRYCGEGFSIGNKGYFGLGYRYPEQNYFLDFWEYDPLEDKWTRKPDFPGKGRYEASSFTLNGDGYVGLGITLMATDQLHLKDFYKYSPNNEEWTKIPDLPGSARYSAVSFVKDGKAFVGTGIIKREDYSLPYDEGIISRDFWSYNPVNEQWNEVLSFPYRTGKAAGLTIGGAGYVYEAGKIKEYTGNFWVDKCSTTYSPRGFEVSFTIGSSGYILFGGVTDIFEFDSNVDQIKKIEMPVQVGCIEPAIFVINRKAYLICGEHNTKSTKTVWEFDPGKP